MTFEADLLRDSIRAIAFPGQASDVVQPFRRQDIMDNVVETDIFPQPAANSGIQVQAASLARRPYFRLRPHKAFPWSPLLRTTRPHWKQSQRRRTLLG